MTRQRHYLNEILKRRSRDFKRVERTRQLQRRMDVLLAAEDWLQHALYVGRRERLELLRHFPVALIATIESYFRMSCRDLINSGEPFISNSKHLRDVSINIELAAAIAARRVTLGEAIAHQLQHSRREHVTETLSTLLNADFIELVELDFGEQKENLHKWIFPIVDEAYQQRHIFCHEIAQMHTVQPRHIRSMLLCGFVFLASIETIIANALGGQKQIEKAHR